MVYTVNIWKRASSHGPDLAAEVEADDPLEAAFMLMRRCRLAVAFCVLVLGEREYDTVEYTDLVCSDREVC